MKPAAARSTTKSYVIIIIKHIVVRKRMKKKKNEKIYRSHLSDIIIIIIRVRVPAGNRARTKNFKKKFGSLDYIGRVGIRSLKM